MSISQDGTRRKGKSSAAGKEEYSMIRLASCHFTPDLKDHHLIIMRWNGISVLAALPTLDRAMSASPGA